MTKQTNYDILLDVQASINRLEDKMDKRITLSNMLKWFRLQEDTQWLKIREICSADGKIKDIFENVDRYMENRRRRFRENAQN